MISRRNRDFPTTTHLNDDEIDDYLANDLYRGAAEHEKNRQAAGYVVPAALMTGGDLVIGLCNSEIDTYDDMVLESIIDDIESDE